MARKPKPSRNDSETKDSFVSAVRLAYEHVNDPDWLGTVSPLASPYVLGTLLLGEPLADTPFGRGLVLQRLLGDAVDAQDELHRSVLTLYYYDPKIQDHAAKRAFLVGKALSCSEAEVYRKLRSALSATAAYIGKQLLPTVRPEMPMARTIFGRSETMSDALQALRAGETVALSGPSGMGKTTTGLAIAESFGRKQTLWFTFRPGLNDTLANLIYAIAFFLKSFGANSVWRQIVADQRILEKETLISGLIRHEFAAIQPPLMLCMDEIGCLDPDLGEHNHIIRFLEGLRDQVPMLLMGNHVLVDLGNRQHHYVLGGIESEAADQLFDTEQARDLSAADKAVVLALTRGNPALMRMFALLHRIGEPMDTSLKRIAEDPSAEAMLYRVFERLSADDQRVLTALSIFKEAAPRDAFQKEDGNALETLIRYGLIQQDLTGGLEVAPFARAFVLRRMPGDLRVEFNRWAGEVMETRGSFTSAAAYFAEAGDISRSIRLWATHWEMEVSRGNAQVALELFRSIDKDRDKLAEDDRRIMALLLADLLTANGHAHEAIHHLDDVSWPDDHALSPRAFKLRGTAYEVNNHAQIALQYYSKAIDLLTKPTLAQRVFLYRNRGYVSGNRLGDFESARNDANQARVDLENLMGTVEEAAGNFELARQHFTNALSLCRSIQANEILAHDCHGNLSRLAWRQDKLDEAFEHVHLALGISQKLGWLTAELIDKINLSAIHLMAAQPAHALEVAENALPEARYIGNNYIIAGLCSNAAEACFGLGRIDDADRHAQEVIQTEEPDHMPNALLVLGRVYRYRKLYEKTLATLELATKAALAGGDQFTCGDAWCELGDVYSDAGDDANAFKCWKKSFAIFQQLGNDRKCQAIEQRMRQSEV